MTGADPTDASPPGQDLVPVPSIPQDSSSLAAKVLEYLELGMGRAMACKEAGLPNFAAFTSLMRDNPDFSDRVLLLEQCRIDMAELNVYSAMVQHGEHDPEINLTYLKLRWKVLATEES